MPEYIERDALIHHFKNCIDEVKNTNGCTDDFEICLKAVQNQPTIDAEPVVHGRWIREDHQDIWGKQVSYEKCSACNIYSPNRLKTKYCGMCGAKMDEEVKK